MPEKPRAIVLITSHRQEKQHGIDCAIQSVTVYGYQSDAPRSDKLKNVMCSSHDLGLRVSELISEAGFDTARVEQCGCHHGVFIPLKMVFPDVDIPIWHISIPENLDIAEYVQLGLALEPLRNEGVLVIGGDMSHYRHYGVYAHGVRQAGSAVTAGGGHIFVHPAKLTSANIPSRRGLLSRTLHMMTSAAGRKAFGKGALSAGISAFRFD